jgi:hypothetical protein
MMPSIVKPAPPFRRRYSHNSSAITEPPGRMSSISAYGARALSRTTAAAAYTPQLRSACVQRASRQIAQTFKIDMEFAEMITVHLVKL